jgi:hypothetical protein
VCSAWEASALDTGKSACATISWLVREGFFHRFRVSIHHRQVGAHRAFRTPAPLLPFLERARALRYPLLSPKGATYHSPGQQPGLNGPPISTEPCRGDPRSGFNPTHIVRRTRPRTSAKISIGIVAWVSIGAPLQGAEILMIPCLPQAVGLGCDRSPLWGSGLIRIGEGAAGGAHIAFYVCAP